MVARSTLSASSWRTTRPREAPNDIRTANSRDRTVARASSTLPMFVQAMRRTIATPAISV